MLTVTLDELELNAVLASLDLRVKSLARQLVALKTQPETRDQRFAVETVEAAIRHTMTATLTIAASVDEEAGLPRCCGADGHTPHFTECRTGQEQRVLAGWSEPELREAWGR